MRSLSRAERRNLRFGRKPVGNTTPEERRAIWEAVKASPPPLPRPRPRRRSDSEDGYINREPARGHGITRDVQMMPKAIASAQKRARLYMHAAARRRAVLA